MYVIDLKHCNNYFDDLSTCTTTEDNTNGNQQHYLKHQ